ncbi:MAG: tetratricopeptide repeat protein [Pseudomonadota bacterium]
MASAGKWRVKKPNGDMAGPFDTDEVKERIRAGEITDKDEVALGDDLFMTVGEKRVFGPSLRAASGGAPTVERQHARGASVRQRSRTPLTIGVLLLLVLAGAIVVAFVKPDLLPGLGGSEVENPFMRQVNLWRLQYPDVEGTADEHLRKGRKYYLDDTEISHRLADDELRKALLLDPDNVDTISAFVENLARLPGIRQRTEDVKAAFEGIEFALKRDGNKASLHRAHGALLLALDNVQKAQSSLHMALRIDAQDPLTLLLLAESDINRNNESAIKQAEQARALDPSLARVDLVVGQALAGQGEFKAALERFNKRLARDAEHIETLMAVANLYIEIGAFQDSVKTLEKVISADDSNRVARLLLGKVYSQALNDQARADLQLTVAAESVASEEDLTEVDLAVLVHLAHVRAMRNKWKEAEGYARHALQADTTFLPAHYMMARVMMNKGEPDEGLKYLDRVLQATQGRYLEAPARIVAGCLRLKRGQNREAASEFQRVVENFPTQIRAYLGLAAANASLGDAANMAMAMRKLIDVEPDVEQNRIMLSDFPSYPSDLDAFMTALKGFQEREDDASIRLSSMGIVAYHQGELASADSYLRQALKEDPKNLAALMYEGAVALRRNNNTAALDHLEKAHEVNRLHIVTRYLLGLAQFKDGRLDASEKTLQDLLNDDSTFLPAMITLGDIARKRNKFAEARDQYMSAFRASLDLLPAKRGLFLVGN